MVTDPSGTVLKTTNKGNAWEVFTSGLGTVLDKIQFIDNNTGWISFYMGNSLLKTTDGGLNWDLKFIDSSLSMYSFHFVNANNGWVVGSYDWETKIFKTTDGGDNWIKSGNPPISDYSSVYFINENVGWAAGGFRFGSWLKGTIVKTTNGGNDWIEQKCPSTIPPSNIYFINENTGWIVGDGIFKTINGGGVVSVKDEWQNEQNVPETFHLYQNYPNPFNPTTKISYQLPTTAQVTLKVYDLLGRELTTLVKEEKEAGTHEVEFDASSLSSGIYLYWITIKDFVKTMKLMVVK